MSQAFGIQCSAVYDDLDTFFLQNLECLSDTIERRVYVAVVFPCRLGLSYAALAWSLASII